MIPTTTTIDPVVRDRIDVDARRAARLASRPDAAERIAAAEAKRRRRALKASTARIKSIASAMGEMSAPRLPDRAILDGRLHRVRPTFGGLTLELDDVAERVKEHAASIGAQVSDELAAKVSDATPAAGLRRRHL